MEPSAERDILARLGEGDPQAFDAVYEAYRPRLFAFLLRLSRRPEVAEDLLGETWLRLVARAGSLPSGTRLAPWLFTVARNLFVSYCRNRLLETSRVAELARLASEPRAGESPLEALASDETGRRLERALALLATPDVDRRRAAAIRAACLARLPRAGAGLSRGSRRGARPAWRTLAPWLATCLGALYLVAALQRAWLLLGP